MPGLALTFYRKAVARIKIGDDIFITIRPKKGFEHQTLVTVDAPKHLKITKDMEDEYEDRNN